jgi:hypothetical protein
VKLPLLRRKVLPPSIEYSNGCSPVAEIIIVPSLKSHWDSPVATADVITGRGFIVMVYLIGVPEHPFNIGVTVIVADTAKAVVLSAVKLGILPVPPAASPIEVLELVQR